MFAAWQIPYDDYAILVGPSTTSYTLVHPETSFSVGQDKSGPHNYPCRPSISPSPIGLAVLSQPTVSIVLDHGYVYRSCSTIIVNIESSPCVGRTDQVTVHVYASQVGRIDT